MSYTIFWSERLWRSYCHCGSVSGHFPTTKPRREICEVFVLCILSLLSPKTYGVFPQGKNHFQQILYLRLSYHKLVLLRIFCSIFLRHHLCLSVTLQFNLQNNLLLCKKSTDLKSQWILIFSSKNLIRVSITPPAAWILPIIKRSELSDEKSIS